MDEEDGCFNPDDEVIEVDNGDDEGDEENSTEQKRGRKAAGAAANLQSKAKSVPAKKLALASEKNNSSILSFFHKSAQQKRSLDAKPQLVSHFMLSRNLRTCTVF